MLPKKSCLSLTFAWYTDMITREHELRVWDRLDRRTRVGLFPHGGSDAESMQQEAGTSYLTHQRSKIDIFGFWKRSEDLRCRHGKPMKDHDFSRWNHAIRAAKENAVRRGG